eukprot:COSAG02_NODE_160_length_32694_cov_18.496947_2_plen_136_part_00
MYGSVQAECGYDVSWQVLNARGWVPQSRERVYIVGFRRDLHVPPMDWAGLKAQSENACSATLADVLEPPESPAVVYDFPPLISMNLLDSIYSLRVSCGAVYYGVEGGTLDACSMVDTAGSVHVLQSLGWPALLYE